jgi:cbb3-type cytochrome oxidase maturation protein
MSVIIILISISILIELTFLVAFIWAVKTGQYDDTFSPSVRMLMDDRKTKKDKKEQAPSND